MFNKFLLPSLLLVFLLSSCAKKIKSFGIDIAFFAQNDLCNGDKLSDKGKELFSPFLLNDLLYKPEGKIYQLANFPLNFIAIADSNYSLAIRLRNKFINNNDTEDAMITNFNNMFENINTIDICKEPSANKITENLKALLATNSNSKIIVLSTTINDSLWNNFKVFNNVSKIKEYIKTSIKSQDSKKILVLIEPEKQDSEPIIPSGLKVTLLSITQNPDPRVRRELANKALSELFTDQVSVKMFKENRNSEPEFWDFHEGKDYIMKRLTSVGSIKDLKIEKVERSITDGKITFLEIIEIHK